MASLLSRGNERAGLGAAPGRRLCEPPRTCKRALSARPYRQPHPSPRRRDGRCRPVPPPSSARHAKRPVGAPAGRPRPCVGNEQKRTVGAALYRARISHRLSQPRRTVCCPGHRKRSPRHRMATMNPQAALLHATSVRIATATSRIAQAAHHAAGQHGSRTSESSRTPQAPVSRRANQTIHRQKPLDIDDSKRISCA